MKLLVTVYFLTLFSYAQKPAFDPEKSTGKLFEYAEFTNVGKSKYAVHDIIRDSLLVYENLKSENHDFGFTSDTYWIRFKLKNSTKVAKTYYLETARPITDVVNIYEIGQTIKVQRNGDQISFDHKAIKHRQIVFKILLNPQTEKEFYMKLSSDGETINLPLNLSNESTFINDNYKQQLFLGLFYGVLVLAGFIYLFFYTSLKNKAFLYYGIYVFSIALMQAALDGFVHQYFLPNGGYFNSRMVLISALFSNYFLLKYCEYFLNIRLHLPSYLKLYRIIYGVLAVLFVMIFISSMTLELVYPISNLNGLLSLLLIIATVITMRFKKISVDTYFSIGIFFLVVGLLGFVLNNLGVLPTNFYTLNSSKFGSGFEVVFLSLSMTNLLGKLREQKEESQRLALKKSEEVSELKTFFMSNMSHELRTPINAIMGIVETELRNTANTQKELEKFQMIRNASISLLSNVNDILDFEKIEKNEIKLTTEVFDPSIILNQISKNWESEALKKGLAYRFEIDSELPTRVTGDADRLLQIINNVLSNAVKFTNTGAVALKMKGIPQPDNMWLFSFQVSDTGIGINKKNKDILFNSFNQMQLNHKRQFGGIGLGLTIAKHLISLFEGSIRIESKLDKGTDVFIELPIKEIHNEEVNVRSNDNPLRPLHILVVEDNKLNQMVMGKHLESFSSISFSIAENGKEALDMLQEETYDLILMDLQMPIMDGYEATKFIRSGSLGMTISNIPIIAVTADAMEETRQHVLHIGMNDYMTKPVVRELLLKKILLYN
ncbi:hybrid sensor histidine kinase/response regulator [Aquimarina sp. M1]